MSSRGLTEAQRRAVQVVQFGHRDLAWLKRELGSEGWKRVEALGVLEDLKTRGADVIEDALGDCEVCGTHDAVRLPNTVCVRCQKALADEYRERIGLKNAE